MHHRLSATYYGLSIFVLGTALFVMQPRNDIAVTLWQDDIKQQMSLGMAQLWGDEPVLADVALVYGGVEKFYEESSLTLFALMSNEQLDSDITFVYGQVYNNFVYMINPEAETKVAGDFDANIDLKIDLANFMTEEPLYDLAVIPAGQTIKEEAGAVAGWTQPSAEPVNLDNAWFTVVDGLTGQEYCMAVYNGEINKYLGKCKYDEYY